MKCHLCCYLSPAIESLIDFHYFAQGLKQCLLKSSNFTVLLGQKFNYLCPKARLVSGSNSTIFILPENLQSCFFSPFHVLCAQCGIEVCAAGSENVLGGSTSDCGERAPESVALHTRSLSVSLCARRFSEHWQSIRGTVCRGGDCRSSAVNKAPQITTCM